MTPLRHELRMPELGLQAAGVGDEPPVLCQWLVGRGATVFEGEGVLEILAGCVLLELTAPVGGRIVEQFCFQDDPLQVGQVLGLIIGEDTTTH
jgi:pyruvate/2-oxoglutarate dehydrogenase complex dihydrolipoamide acyltransferase (E2) component